LFLVGKVVGVSEVVGWDFVCAVVSRGFLYLLVHGSQAKTGQEARMGLQFPDPVSQSLPLVFVEMSFLGLAIARCTGWIGRFSY